jgi:pimeloyl-ACP methyl ester carboxylesterase
MMRLPSSVSARRIAVGVVSVALLVGCSSEPSGEPVPSTDAPTPTVVDGSFDVGDGRTLHMECSGEGSPTVILEADDESGVEEWSQVMPDVAELTRTCAYDRAGVGLSDPATGCRGLDDLTGDLERLLAAAEIPAAYVLVAASGGGFIASGFSADHRDAIAGVVFVDVLGPFPDPPPDLVEFLKCDAPTNIERRDYLGVEHAGWDARAEIGDIPVTVMSVDYGPNATMEVEKTNVDVQPGWLVFSPRATQVVVHTGHDIVGEDPQHVIEEIELVLKETSP